MTFMGMGMVATAFGLPAIGMGLVVWLVRAEAIESAAQFAGILPADLLAMGVHPIAQLGRTERGGFDVEPLLHQAFDFIARIDYISDHPTEHADALESEPRRHRHDQCLRAD